MLDAGDLDSCAFASPICPPSAEEAASPSTSFGREMQNTHPTSTDGGSYMRHSELGRAISNLIGRLGFNVRHPWRRHRPPIVKLLLNLRLGVMNQARRGLSLAGNP